jgi:PKD repeat protein
MAWTTAATRVWVSDPEPGGGADPIVLTLTPLGDQGAPGAVACSIATLTGGTEPYTYAWAAEGPGAAPGSWDDDTIAAPTLTTSARGVWSVTLTVTDADGVTQAATSVLEVAAAAPLTVSIASVPDQDDMSAVVLAATISGGEAPYTYAWTVLGIAGTLSSSTVEDPTYTPTDIGHHTLQLVVTDDAGITQSDAVAWRVAWVAPAVEYDPGDGIEYGAVRAYLVWETMSAGFAAGGVVITEGTVS